MSDLIALRDAMRTFTAERNWETYHDPKSLILALVGEVGELAEIFQWLPVDEAKALVSDEPRQTPTKEELADVLLYLIRLADVLEIDLGQAAVDKLEKNRLKHQIGSAPDSPSACGNVL